MQAVLTIVDRSHCTRVPPPPRPLLRVSGPQSPPSTAFPPAFLFLSFLASSSLSSRHSRGPFCIPWPPLYPLAALSAPVGSRFPPYAHLKCVYTPSLASSFVKRARVVVLARSRENLEPIAPYPPSRGDRSTRVGPSNALSACCLLSGEYN